MYTWNRLIEILKNVESSANSKNIPIAAFESWFKIVLYSIDPIPDQLVVDSTITEDAIKYGKLNPSLLANGPKELLRIWCL